MPGVSRRSQSWKSQEEAIFMILPCDRPQGRHREWCADIRIQEEAVFVVVHLTLMLRSICPALRVSAGWESFTTRKTALYF
jgi:hypothetical protein